MIRRELRAEFFFASTVEEIGQKVSEFLEANSICPGNYVHSHLYKNGSIYQYEFLYAVMREIN